MINSKKKNTEENEFKKKDLKRVVKRDININNYCG